MFCNPRTTDLEASKIFGSSSAIKKGDAENIICLGEASNESFMDLKGGLDPNDISYDITPHKCTLPRLQSISFDFPGDD